jgi:hypothetical protein
MRFSYRMLILLAAAGSVFAAKKIVSPTVTGGNDEIDVVATIYMTEAEVTQKLGMDPGPDVALVTVRVTPRTEKSLQVGPDDFILLAHDDGERNKPFDPAEMAGKGAMIEQTAPQQTKKGGKTSITGMMGGMGAGSGSPGNTHIDPVTGTKMDDKAAGNAKLLQQLKSKQLPEKDTPDPVEGFLYFPLDGKHKLKNMALLYRGAAGKLNLEFQH